MYAVTDPAHREDKVLRKRLVNMHIIQEEIMGKKKKYGGHYCWVCKRIRANEKFSGKGHAKHICKDCWSKRKIEKKKLANQE